MGENTWHSISKLATASLATKQFYGVKLDSAGGVVIASAAGESILGVLQNKPAAGQAATVAVAGIVQMIAGGVIAPGGKVKVSSAGKALAAALGTTTVDGNAQSNVALLGSYVFGEYMGYANCADGDIIDVLITREGAVPTTAG